MVKFYMDDMEFFLIIYYFIYIWVNIFYCWYLILIDIVRVVVYLSSMWVYKMEFYWYYLIIIGSGDL